MLPATKPRLSMTQPPARLPAAHGRQLALREPCPSQPQIPKQGTAPYPPSLPGEGLLPAHAGLAGLLPRIRRDHDAGGVFPRDANDGFWAGGATTRGTRTKWDRRNTQYSPSVGCFFTQSAATDWSLASRPSSTRTTGQCGSGPVPLCVPRRLPFRIWLDVPRRSRSLRVPRVGVSTALAGGAVALASAGCASGLAGNAATAATAYLPPPSSPPAARQYLPGAAASVGPCASADLPGTADSYNFSTKASARSECVLRGCTGLAAAAT